MQRATFARRVCVAVAITTLAALVLALLWAATAHQSSIRAEQRQSEHQLRISRSDFVTRRALLKELARPRTLKPSLMSHFESDARFGRRRSSYTDVMAGTLRCQVSAPV